MSHHDQRYVSKELTHFVGRHLVPNEDAQYDLLVNILTTGQLKRPKGATMPDNLGPIAELKRKGLVSNNDLFDFPKMVCFCDIPVGDLQLHMGKYGKFGLSFAKEFLTPRGARPVRYLPKKAAPDYYLSPAARAFDAVTPAFLKLHDIFTHLSQGQEGDERLKRALKDALPEMPDHYIRARTVKDCSEFLQFFLFEILGHLVVFDHELDDDDQHNYYMEREWRTLQDVSFSLSDVYRVILPQKYARQFRIDFPNYIGQITFADK